MGLICITKQFRTSRIVQLKVINLENNQMEPDIKVRNESNIMTSGIDQQLEAAAKELLKN